MSVRVCIDTHTTLRAPTPLHLSTHTVRRLWHAEAFAILCCKEAVLPQMLARRKIDPNLIPKLLRHNTLDHCDWMQYLCVLTADRLTVARLGFAMVAFSTHALAGCPLAPRAALSLWRPAWSGSLA
jgi:hypothetical protein